MEPSPDQDSTARPSGQSFRATDFTARDFPRLLLAFALVTAFGLLAGWLPSRFLPENLKLLPLAVMLGFVLGIWFWRRVVGHAPAVHHELSAETIALARQPSTVAAAVASFMAAHPEVSTLQARERIDRFLRTGK
jgi:signal transduction histidine kinase